MSGENTKLPPNAPKGLVQRDNFDAYSEDCVVVARDYLCWLATVLAEQCACRYNEGDHALCLKEVDKFITFFDEEDTL